MAKKITKKRKSGEKNCEKRKSGEKSGEKVKVAKKITKKRKSVEKNYEKKEKEAKKITYETRLSTLENFKKIKIIFSIFFR